MIAFVLARFGRVCLGHHGCAGRECSARLEGRGRAIVERVVIYEDLVGGLGSPLGGEVMGGLGEFLVRRLWRGSCYWRCRRFGCGGGWRRA